MPRAPDRHQESRATLSDWETAPVRLAVIADELRVSVESLRKEHRAGRLVISRIAGKDGTTRADIQRRYEQCRLDPKAPACGSAVPEPAPAGEAELAVWLIRDGNHVVSTGCGAADRAEAEKRLAAYIAGENSR